jgi:alpha-L-fucosidase
LYEATWESVGTHAVPDGYDDAKLGVFIHWGLYSVPGWAPRVPDIQEILLKSGPEQPAVTTLALGPGVRARSNPDS